MRSSNKSYVSINDSQHVRLEETPWYWRLIALAASWMILGGYLMLPGLYAKDPQLRINQAVLSVFVVALLTAGYSFTALLCFACRNEVFQADSVFLPALASSTLGILSIAYNFGLSRAYNWETASISGTVISILAIVTYTILLIWTKRRVNKIKEQSGSRTQLYSDPNYYSNFNANMYPTAARSPAPAPEAPVSDDERVNQQMALLLMKSDSRPSPDANSATFRIDMPEDRELQERQMHSQELVGTPGPAHGDWNRNRANSKPDSLSEDQAWQQWQNRGRSPQRPGSASGRSSHTRNLSREERRREIELGHP